MSPLEARRVFEVSPEAEPGHSGIGRGRSTASPAPAEVLPIYLRQMEAFSLIDGSEERRLARARGHDWGARMETLCASVGRALDPRAGREP